MYLAKELKKFVPYSAEWFATAKTLLDHFFKLFIENFKPFGEFKLIKEETPFGWIVRIHGMPGAVTCSVQTDFNMTLLKPNGETKLYDVGNDWTQPAHDLLCVSTGLDSPTMDIWYFRKTVEERVKESARLNELPDYNIEYLGTRPRYNSKGKLYCYQNVAILTSSAFKGREIEITSSSAYIRALIKGCCSTDIVHGTALLLDDVNGGEYKTYTHREKLHEKQEQERLECIRNYK